MGRVRLSVWMLAVTLILGAAMLLLPRLESFMPEASAQVVLTEVELGSVEQVVSVTGRVRYASEYAALAPQTGIVAQVYVTAGQAVKAGQALFRLEGQTQERLLSGMLAAGDDWQEQAAFLGTGEQALMEEASTVLENLTVRAPADGLVHQVNVVEHGGVMAGGAAVMLSSGEQRVICPVVMTDAVKLRPGMRARLSIRDMPLGEAEVLSVGVLETDMQTGQTIAQVSLMPEQTLELPLGAAIETDIILQAQAEVPVIPLEALSEEGKVWWVAEGRCYAMEAGVQLTDELNAWVTLPVGLTLAIGENLEEGMLCREVQP